MTRRESYALNGWRPYAISAAAILGGTYTIWREWTRASRFINDVAGDA